MKLGLPTCPKCGSDMPGRLLVWGLGKPYECPQCGAKQVVPKGSGMGIALVAFLIHWRLKDSLSGGQEIALVIGLLAAVALLSWLTMRPRLVAPTEANPESLD